MLPRLVATDLDGTLVRSDGTVSELTRRVLAELDERDVPVVIVTARPLRWMDDLWPMVGRHGFAIVSNGAIWYDVAAGRVRDLQRHRGGGRAAPSSRRSSGPCPKLGSPSRRCRAS